MSPTTVTTRRCDVLLLGGAPRSGTGLLRRIVGSHPDVALPSVELALHRRWSSGQPIDAAIEELRPRLSGIDVDGLDRSSYAALFRSLLAGMSTATGRPITGDKTPGIERFVDLYQDWVPDRRLGLVQMVRHPFDAVASHLHAPWYDARSDADAVATIAQGWADSAAVALDGNRLAALHVVVRFEELTATPHSVAVAICDTIGIDDSAAAIDAMVEGRDFPRHVNSSFGIVGQHLEGTVHRSMRRDGHLTAAQRRIVADVCGPSADRLGYLLGS